MITEGQFLLFLIETTCCDPSSERLDETLQMRGHSICFYAQLIKIVPNYHQNTPSYLHLLAELWNIIYTVEWSKNKNTAGKLAHSYLCVFTLMNFKLIIFLCKFLAMIKSIGTEDVDIIVSDASCA